MTPYTIGVIVKNAAYAAICITFWSIVLMAAGTAAAVSFYFLYAV